MSRPAVQEQKSVEWGVASRPTSGEAVSGDLYLVKPFDHGVLLAAVDGVGHGGEATAAARVAVDILEKHAPESIISLVKRCHDALAQTRGAVMTVASFNTLDHTLTWLGVGNVEGMLLRTDTRHPTEHVLLRGGVVGYQLPALHASVMPVMPGDVLVLATDGIRGDFADAVVLKGAPKRLASHILEHHFKGNDDALVLVARYLAGQHE